MSYCFEVGIPHSEFLEWADEDRAKVAAYALERANYCSRCGTAEWEWEDDSFAYQPMTRTCKGCQKRDLLQSDVSQDNAPGQSVVLVPKATAEKIEARQAGTRDARARARAAREAAAI